MQGIWCSASGGGKFYPDWFEQEMRHVLGVTVAIVVHNEEKNLGRALVSLQLEIARSYAWEVLVIDNESSDRTHEVFLQCQTRFIDAPLRWIPSKENSLGRARQLALLEARFSVVAFLDADCEAPPGWMNYFAQAMQERAGNGQLLGIGGGNLPPAGPAPFHLALRLATTSWLGSLGFLQARPLQQEAVVPHLPTCNVFYFRERALEIGGFSDSFPTVCEDLDFSYRATKAGYILVFLPDANVTHYHQEGWLRWSSKMFRYGQGQMLLARRHPRHMLGKKAIPLLGGLVVLLGLMISPLVVLLLLAAWLAVLALFSAYFSFTSRQPSLWPSLLIAFVTTQVSYCGGEIIGLIYPHSLRGFRRRK